MELAGSLKCLIPVNIHEEERKLQRIIGTHLPCSLLRSLFAMLVSSLKFLRSLRWEKQMKWMEGGEKEEKGERRGNFISAAGSF
jgi:hypothetical protein